MPLEFAEPEPEQDNHNQSLAEEVDPGFAERARIHREHMEYLDRQGADYGGRHEWEQVMRAMGRRRY